MNLNPAATTNTDMTTYDKHVTDTVDIWLDENGIIWMVDHKGAEERIEHARENVATVWKASGGIKRPVLIDIRQLKSITREAREYYAGEEVANFGSSVALLTSSPATKVIGNFFLKFNKPTLPFRIFTSELEAVHWLKGFI
ncbi:MAG: hypothetical protein OEY64_05780 [Nitrospinota bacterium]|nr:hypothetical protein [Nitrospinota bacterium]